MSERLLLMSGFYNTHHLYFLSDEEELRVLATEFRALYGNDIWSDEHDALLDRYGEGYSLPLAFANWLRERAPERVEEVHTVHARDLGLES